MYTKYFSSKCADVKSVLKKQPLVRAIALALLAGSMAIPATGWAATDCNAVTQIPKAQCEALVSLYTSTNGAKWSDAATNNWNVTNTPCDNWAGIRCSNGNVTQILRHDVYMTGTLPNSFSALTGLQILDLSWNYFTGGIPSSLVSLPNLQVLNLMLGNTISGLTGGIPNLSALTSLKELNLSRQSQGGTIPDLSKLTNLEVIDLSASSNSVKLFGTIPELSTLTKLRVLNLTNNQLDGNIPDLSKSTNLVELRLSQNRLSGNIPNLSTLTNLQVLELSSNQLTGNIPSWSGLGSLTTVNLQNNQLSGAIPNWSALSGASYIYLNNNKLSGPIPDPANLIKVGYLYLSGNQLCGNIPVALGDIWVPYLTLGTNRLIIPTDAAQLAKLNGKTNNAVDTTWKTTQIPTECNAPSQLALSVTATNGSVSCNGTTCQTSYPANTALTLTATPSSGYKFDSWGGACSGTTSCQVTMDVAKSVTANFSAISGYSLTTNATNGTVKCNDGTCQTSYAKDTQLTLTAAANSGYTFKDWSGDCSGTSCQVTMMANKNVTANFSKVPVDSYALTTNATNGAVKCNGDTCQTSYAKDTQLTLTATPNSGYQFANWSGDCAGTSTCQVTMTANKSVTASFSKDNCTTNCPLVTVDSCPNHATYSLEDYRLTIPVVQVPLTSLLGDAIGESLYYEAILKQINGTSDRFALQTVTELVGVKTDESCAVAHYSLDDSTVQLPYVDVAKMAYNPISKENYKAGVDTYEVLLKWMPVLGAEVFVVEELKKLP